MKNLICILLLLNALLTNAQERWILSSPNLAKPDTVLIFKPKAYDQKKEYPLVYLLHGYSENYRQWSKTVNLQNLSDQYGFIIVTPDGFTSWYLNSPFDKHSRYEDFFFNELVPKIHRSFNVDRKDIFISGLSMGGYGSLRYFLMHQDYFNTAASTSGALDLNFDHLQKASLLFFGSERITEDLAQLLGNHLTHNWEQYSISGLLKNHKPNKIFLLDCGTDDILYPATLKVKSLAEEMANPVIFISQPGNHNTDYWKKSIEYHFVFFRQKLVN